MKNTIISPSTREESIKRNVIARGVSKSWWITRSTGSKAGGSSNIERSESYLPIRVPRHGAGQPDPCRNDVEKRKCWYRFTSFLVKWASADRGTGEIRTRLSDLVVEQLWIKIASPLVDDVLPSFKQHQFSDPRISSKYVILVNQLPDRASSARISTIPSLSWICI